MPAAQRIGSQEFNEQTGQSKARQVYIVTGTTDQGSARSAVKSEAPTTWDGLVRDAVHVRELADSLWEGVVSYKAPGNAKKEVGDSTYSFDTGGGRTLTRQSRSVEGTYVVAGGTAPDVKGGIGWNGKEFVGTDIIVPEYRFSETHVLAAATVTDTYKGTLFELTGTVNNASFKGLSAGEGLFLGASGTKRGDGDWEITFSFAATPNATNLSIGDITVTSKDGWDYLDVLYQKVVDGDELVAQPYAAYVHRVYRRTDFSALGIGT